VIYFSNQKLQYGEWLTRPGITFELNPKSVPNERRVKSQLTFRCLLNV